MTEKDKSEIPATMADIAKLIQILALHNEVDSKIHKFVEILDGDIKEAMRRIEELENKCT